jgi:hypothetical protein
MFRRLSDHGQGDVVGEPEEGAQESRSAGFGVDPVDERPVDLDGVEFDVVEPAQRGVADPEVVE